METKQEKAPAAGAPIFKARTYRACLSEGIKLPTQNVILLTKHLWTSMLLASMWLALAGVWAMDGVEWMMRAIGRALAEGPEYAAWGPVFVAVLVTTLVLAFPISFCVGQFTTLLRRYAELGYVPVALQTRPFCRAVWVNAGRALGAIFVPLFLFLAIVTVWGLTAPSWWIYVAWPVWLGLVLPFTYYQVRGQVLGGNRDLLRTFPRATLKDWGAYLAVLFLGSLLFVVLAAVALLPTLTLFLAQFQALNDVLQEDVVTFPAYFPVLSFVCALVGVWLTCMLGWLWFFPQALWFLGKSGESESADGAI